MAEEDGVYILANELLAFVDEWVATHPETKRSDVISALGATIGLYCWRDGCEQGQNAPLKSDN